MLHRHQEGRGDCPQSRVPQPRAPPPPQSTQHPTQMRQRVSPSNKNQARGWWQPSSPGVLWPPGFSRAWQMTPATAHQAPVTARQADSTWAQHREHGLGSLSTQGPLGSQLVPPPPGPSPRVSQHPHKGRAGPRHGDAEGTVTVQPVLLRMHEGLITLKSYQCLRDSSGRGTGIKKKNTGRI